MANKTTDAQTFILHTFIRFQKNRFLFCCLVVNWMKFPYTHAYIYKIHSYTYKFISIEIIVFSPFFFFLSFCCCIFLGYYYGANYSDPHQSRRFRYEFNMQMAGLLFKFHIFCCCCLHCFWKLFCTEMVAIKVSHLHIKYAWMCDMISFSFEPDQKLHWKDGFFQLKHIKSQVQSDSLKISNSYGCNRTFSNIIVSYHFWGIPYENPIATTFSFYIKSFKIEANKHV